MITCMCIFRDLESGLSKRISVRTRYTRLLKAKDKSNHLVADFFEVFFFFIRTVFIR